MFEPLLPQQQLAEACSTTLPGLPGLLHFWKIISLRFGGGLGMLSISLNLPYSNFSRPITARTAVPGGRIPPPFASCTLPSTVSWLVGWCGVLPFSLEAERHAWPVAVPSGVDLDLEREIPGC